MVFFSDQDGKQGIYNCWPYHSVNSLLLMYVSYMVDCVLHSIRRFLHSFDNSDVSEDTDDLYGLMNSLSSPAVASAQNSSHPS